MDLPYDKRSMSLLRWILTLLAFAALVAPRTQVQPYFERRSFAPAAEPPLTKENTVRVLPDARVLQRVWIPDVLSRVDFFAFNRETFRIAPPKVAVREDSSGRPAGLVNATARVVVLKEAAGLVRIRADLTEPLHGPARWVWFEITPQGDSVLTLTREISNEAYPGGELRVETEGGDQTLHGVMDFALARPIPQFPSVIALAASVGLIAVLWIPALGRYHRRDLENIWSSQPSSQERT